MLISFRPPLYSLTKVFFLCSRITNPLDSFTVASSLFLSSLPGSRCQEGLANIAGREYYVTDHLERTYCVRTIQILTSPHSPLPVSKVQQRYDVVV